MNERDTIILKAELRAFNRFRVCKSERDVVAAFKSPSDVVQQFFQVRTVDKHHKEKKIIFYRICQDRLLINEPRNVIPHVCTR